MAKMKHRTPAEALRFLQVSNIFHFVISPYNMLYITKERQMRIWKLINYNSIWRIRVLA